MTAKGNHAKQSAHKNAVLLCKDGLREAMESVERHRQNIANGSRYSESRTYASESLLNAAEHDAEAYRLLLSLLDGAK